MKTSRRCWISLLVTLLVALIFGSGCSPASEPPTEGQPTAPPAAAYEALPGAESTSSSNITEQQAIVQEPPEADRARSESSEQAVATKPAQAASSTESVEKKVTISIDKGKKDGIVLKPTEVHLQSNDTVLDVLKRVTRSNKIQMEYRGTGSGAYVEGIDNLYEFDEGAKSGWMYRVNGDFPNKGAGSYTLKAGDRIEWVYTKDLGKDVGAKVP